AVPPGWTALLGAVPLSLGLWQLRNLRGNFSGPGVDEESVEAERLMEGRMHSQLLGVAAVTVANGSDNLSVYIPLFVAHLAWLPLYIATFAVMTALWCALAHRLVRNRAVGALMQRWGCTSCGARACCWSESHMLNAGRKPMNDNTRSRATPRSWRGAVIALAIGVLS